MAVISGIIFYNATTYSVNLDTSKLEETKSVNNLQIFDTNKNLINLSSENYIPISKLSTNCNTPPFFSNKKSQIQRQKQNGADFSLQ